jgi:competence ComEA-like helix-hairpin-helix protein
MLKPLLLTTSLLISGNLFAYCIEINHATEKDFRKYLPHIGKGKARLIVAYRQRYNGFSSLYELEAVQGIGPKYLEKNLKIIQTYFCHSSEGSGTSLG